MMVADSCLFPGTRSIFISGPDSGIGVFKHSSTTDFHRAWSSWIKSGIGIFSGSLKKINLFPVFLIPALRRWCFRCTFATASFTVIGSGAGFTCKAITAHNGCAAFIIVNASSM